MQGVRPAKLRRARPGACRQGGRARRRTAWSAARDVRGRRPHRRGRPAARFAARGRSSKVGRHLLRRLALVQEYEVDVRTGPLRGMQHGHFALAGRAPGRPEVDDCGATIVVGERNRGPIHCGQGKLGHADIVGCVRGQDQRAREPRAGAHNRGGRKRPAQHGAARQYHPCVGQRSADTDHCMPAAIANVQDPQRVFQVGIAELHDECEARNDQSNQHGAQQLPVHLGGLVLAQAPPGPACNQEGGDAHQQRQRED